MTNLIARPRPMLTKLPEPTALLLARLRAAATYLDNVAGNCLSDDAHATALGHAGIVWQAVDRLDDLARLVEELLPFDPSEKPE